MSTINREMHAKWYEKYGRVFEIAWRAVLTTNFHY